MKMDTRFAAIMTLAIAGTLASAISEVKAAPIQVGSSATNPVVRPDTTSKIQVNPSVSDRFNKGAVYKPGKPDLSKKGKSTVMCPW